MFHSTVFIASLRMRLIKIQLTSELLLIIRRCQEILCTVRKPYKLVYPRIGPSDLFDLNCLVVLSEALMSLEAPILNLHNSCT
jgi:hypothetical protein